MAALPKNGKSPGKNAQNSQLVVKNALVGMIGIGEFGQNQLKLKDDIIKDYQNFFKALNKSLGYTFSYYNSSKQAQFCEERVADPTKLDFATSITLEEVKSFFTSLQERLNNKQYGYDCLIIIWCGHSNIEDNVGTQLMTTDGEILLLEDVAAEFSDKVCPGLTGRPRIFFADACRGMTNPGKVKGQPQYRGGGTGTDKAKEQDKEKIKEVLDKFYEKQSLFATHEHFYCVFSTGYGWMALGTYLGLSLKQVIGSAINKYIDKIKYSELIRKMRKRAVVLAGATPQIISVNKRGDFLLQMVPMKNDDKRPSVSATESLSAYDPASLTNPLVVVVGSGHYMGPEPHRQDIRNIVKQNYILAIECFYGSLGLDVVYQVNDPKSGDTETKILMAGVDDKESYKKENFRMSYCTELVDHQRDTTLNQDVIEILRSPASKYDGIVMILFGRGEPHLQQPVHVSNWYDTNFETLYLFQIYQGLSDFWFPKLYFVDLLWEGPSKEIDIEDEIDWEEFENPEHKQFTLPNKLKQASKQAASKTQAADETENKNAGSNDDAKNADETSDNTRNDSKPKVEYYNSLKVVSNVDKNVWLGKENKGSFFMNVLKRFFEQEVNTFGAPSLEDVGNDLMVFAKQQFGLQHPDLKRNFGEVVALEDTTTDSVWKVSPPK